MTTLTVPRELLKQALNVIERHGYLNLQEALRAVLAQPQQERTCGTCKHDVPKGCAATAMCDSHNQWEPR